MPLQRLLRRAGGLTGNTSLARNFPILVHWTVIRRRREAARAAGLLRAERKVSLEGIHRINVLEWNPGLCHLSTRFWPEEIVEMHTLFGFPEQVKLDNGCVESGLTSLAMLLSYLALPSRHFDLSMIYGRDRSIIGRIVRYSQRWINSRWGHLLKWNPKRLNPERLEEIAAALVDHKDCPLDNCVGYIDGTVWKISRPQKNQRVFYNGHKRSHAIKYQAVTTPDGITVDLSVPFVGARHDTCMIGASQIQELIRRHGKGRDGRQMMLYGDKGYYPNDVIMTPFLGSEALMPRYQVRFNHMMSKCRIGVEHEFGRTRNVLRHTQYEDNLMFYKNDLDELYRVAVFFKNCLVCFGRGPGGAPLPPPSLAEYLRG